MVFICLQNSPKIYHKTKKKANSIELAFCGTTKVDFKILFSQYPAYLV